jgi:hypothetical protein
MVIDPVTWLVRPTPSVSTPNRTSVTRYPTWESGVIVQVEPPSSAGGAVSAGGSVAGGSVAGGAVVAGSVAAGRGGGRGGRVGRLVSRLVVDRQGGVEVALVELVGAVVQDVGVEEDRAVAEHEDGERAEQAPLQPAGEAAAGVWGGVGHGCSGGTIVDVAATSCHGVAPIGRRGAHDPVQASMRTGCSGRATPCRS